MLLIHTFFRESFLVWINSDYGGKPMEIVMQDAIGLIVGEVNSWYRTANAPKNKVVAYIVEQIVMQMNGIAILDDKGNGLCYVWNGIYFEYTSVATWGRTLRQIFCDSYLPFVYCTRDRNEFYNTLIEQWEISKLDVERLNSNLGVLPFKNGYYFRENHTFVHKDLGQGVFSCNPEYRFTTCVDVDWPEEFKPPVEFLKFLAQLIEKPKDQKDVLEYMAYCLTPRTDWQFHMVLVGPPGCGKSEFTKFLPLLIPDLCCYLPLDTILDKNKNKFTGAEMKGKWVNNGAELDSKAMTSDGVNYFKRITGEKYFRGEAKNKDAVKIYNMLKGFYPINNTVKPSTYVDTAFFERLCLKACNEFKGSNTYNLAEKIFAEEGPMIARMLVEMDLPNKNRMDADESEKMWMAHLHSAYIFFNEICIPGESKSVDLYENYKTWCKDTKRYPAKYGGFGRLLKSSGVNKNAKMYKGERFYIYDHTSTYMAEEHRVMNDDEVELLKIFVEDYI